MVRLTQKLLTEALSVRKIWAHVARAHQREVGHSRQLRLQSSRAFLYQGLEGEANKVKINRKSRKLRTRSQYDLRQQDRRNLNNGLYSSLWSWLSRLHQDRDLKLISGCDSVCCHVRADTGQRRGKDGNP